MDEAPTLRGYRGSAALCEQMRAGSSICLRVAISCNTVWGLGQPVRVPHPGLTRYTRYKPARTRRVKTRGNGIVVETGAPSGLPGSRKVLEYMCPK
jgi:hypothetical protein